MKDQIKIQGEGGKIHQEGIFAGDQIENQENAVPLSFNSTSNIKRTLLAGMKKKINPRLLIL
ncbi:hypothetical protein [Pedobacter cryoconitis]|uniref:Uncharacterized protein n=1 Tax=Pedobacter cryoconitis TaxID=188932 RepID=A0A7X0J645_9SPHI|nr:hypothetical protein [Pedobacter cryoconitis]MBB6501540.1 hypothetical protein [Pedobacter cryoconitis]